MSELMSKRDWNFSEFPRVLYNSVYPSREEAIKAGKEHIKYEANLTGDFSIRHFYVGQITEIDNKLVFIKPPEKIYIE